jgi:hypothetical protein
MQWRAVEVAAALYEAAMPARGCIQLHPTPGTLLHKYYHQPCQLLPNFLTPFFGKADKKSSAILLTEAEVCSVCCRFCGLRPKFLSDGKQWLSRRASTKQRLWYYLLHP